jgi:hypothetical protein
MGNQPARSSSLGYPNKQLKSKAGDRTDPIPCPISKSSYQTLYNDPEFKDYVLQNLNSSFFIQSLLQNSSDETIVMEGIPYFQTSSRERRTEINNDVKKFQDFIISGLQVKFPPRYFLNQPRHHFQQQFKFVKKILNSTRVHVVHPIFARCSAD